MPNGYFKAKSLWDSGQHAAGFSLISNELGKQLGYPVFRKFSALRGWSGHQCNFSTFVYWLLKHDRVPEISFCALFPLIWKMNPAPYWIEMLLEMDVYSEFRFANHGEQQIITAEIDAMVNLLVDAAVDGFLGGDQNESAHIRRATLPIARLEQVDAYQWGPLKTALLQRLPEAYSQCPCDFWVRLATTNVDEFLMQFLQSIFLDVPIETSEIRWKALLYSEPAYADTVKVSFEKLLASQPDPDWLTELVRIDAGFVSVTDGEAWLRELMHRLQVDKFSSFAFKL